MRRLCRNGNDFEMAKMAKMSGCVWSEERGVMLLSWDPSIYLRPLLAELQPLASSSTVLPRIFLDVWLLTRVTPSE